MQVSRDVGAECRLSAEGRAVVPPDRRPPAPPAALVFAFLYAMIDIFKGYFEDDFDEDSIRDNLCVREETQDAVGGWLCD